MVIIHIHIYIKKVIQVTIFIYTLYIDIFVLIRFIKVKVNIILCNINKEKGLLQQKNRIYSSRLQTLVASMDSTQK